MLAFWAQMNGSTMSYLTGSALLAVGAALVGVAVTAHGIHRVTRLIK